MLRQAAVALLLAGLTVAGCRSRQETTVPTDDLKQSFTRINPNVQVGTVAAILPEQHLLAINDLPVDQFEVGETLVFMNEDQQIIAAGHVVRKTETSLHIDYSPNEKGIEPKVGDIAVRPAN